MLILETKFLHYKKVAPNDSFCGKNLLLTFLHFEETSNWDTFLYLKVRPEVPEWRESNSVYK